MISRLKHGTALGALAAALALGGPAAHGASDGYTPVANPDFRAGHAAATDLVLDSLLLSAAQAGSRLVVVGEFGHVALSDDDGKTWRQAKDVPTQATLTSVTFIDETHGWAAGHDKTIIATADAGETWTVQYSRDISAAAGIPLEARGRAEEPAPVEDGALAPDGEDAANGEADAADAAADTADAGDTGLSTTDDGFVDGDVTGSDIEPDIPFLGLAFNSPTHGIAVGGFNYAVETTDGGKTWTPKRLVRSAADDFHLNAAFNGPDNSLFVPSEYGQVYRSLDGGATWSISQTAYEGSFWGGLTLKDGSVLVVGMRGNVWRTRDKGATWEQLAVDATPESLSSGVQLEDGTIILVGIGGVILRSTDDGATWDTELSQVDRKGIAAVAEGSGVLLLMGEAGLKQKPWDGKPQG